VTRRELVVGDPLDVRLLLRKEAPDPDVGIPAAVGRDGVDLDPEAFVVGGR
jgi:hypothetical protein